MQKSPANNHSAEGLDVIQHAHEARSEEDGDGDHFPITNCAPTKSATAPEEATAFADLRCLLVLLCSFTSPVRPFDLQGRGNAGEDVLREVPHHAGGEGVRSFRLGPTRGQRTLAHPELEQADAEVLSSVETTRPLHMTSSFFGTLSESTSKTCRRFSSFLTRLAAAWSRLRSKCRGGGARGGCGTRTA